VRQGIPVIYVRGGANAKWWGEAAAIRERNLGGFGGVKETRTNFG